MNQKIKLVMSDIDGTLINKENKVSERTKKAVHDLIDSGIEFGVATGRNYDSAVGIVKQLGLDPHVVPIVSLNGKFTFTWMIYQLKTLNLMLKQIF